VVGILKVPGWARVRRRRLAQAAILILAVIVLWLSHRLDAPTNTWWPSLLQNFGAGLCSALVLIWLYDQVIEYEANKAKAERNRIAADQLVAPLRSQIYGLLFPMYRSAVRKRPEKEIESWREFLTLHFPEEVTQLDISARSPGSYPLVTPYPRYISNHLSRFSNELQSWLNKYSATVDADLVETLEQVTSSGFMMLGSSLEQFMQFVPPDFPFMNAFRFDRAMCLEYGTKLSNLVDAVERKLPKSISRFEPEYWHNAFLDVGYARRADSP
jgi:hypothetical protein